MSDHTTQDTSVKLCECGCGQPAPIAKRTNAKLGHIAGQPVRFIRGHHNKVRPLHPVEDRFWAKVIKRGPDECWDWTGCTDKHGYGYLNVGNRRTERAYRISYELHRGPIPFGLSVCHRCDHPNCVNPAHLFVGTQQDNMGDMIAKGRNSPPPRNDVRGEKHGQATFTDREVIALREEFAHKHMSVSAFAELHGTPKVTMWRILRRKNYTHV